MPNPNELERLMYEASKATIGMMAQDEKVPSALSTQVGGGHYKDFVIQPIEFISKNNLDFLQGNVVKYVCRHKTKNGVEDINKAIHYLQLLKGLQYGKA